MQQPIEWEEVNVGQSVSRPWVSSWRWISSDTPRSPVCASWTPPWTVAERRRNRRRREEKKVNKKSVHQGVCVRFVWALFRCDERWGISLWLDVQENERLSGCWCGDTYADPWMLEGLLSCDPLGWIDGQHLVDQVFGLWSDCVPLWGGELKRKTEPHLNIHC